MTAKPPPPRPDNPLAVPRAVLLPPTARSRAAIALANAAAEGRFALQVCAACAAVQYPPREICHACLHHVLPWRDLPRDGRVLATTTIHASADPYFRARAPWRIGTVQLACGAIVVAHLHGDVALGNAVRMTLRLDKSGQGVMLAMPAKDTPNMNDDPQLREMTCDPRGRRILITDGRSPTGQALAAALQQAGAREIFIGIAEPWRPFPARASLVGSEIDLDITDETGVQRCAASLGGRIEILANTALHVRPGGIAAGTSMATARAEMETNYFGALRLARHFGPALRARAADGATPACAWVGLASIYGLAALPDHGGFSAAQAAALSVLQTLRAELRPIRVLRALTGPIDDEWHQSTPPPKVAPAALAAAIVAALQQGLEHIAVGDVAQDFLARYRDNPDTLARELAT